MTVILYAAGTACLVLGCFFVAAMAVGMLRFPDAYTRLHAGTKGLTIGAGFLITGAALHAPDLLHALRIMLVGILLIITNPVATQAIAKANYQFKKSRQHMVIDEYAEYKNSSDQEDIEQEDIDDSGY